MKYILKHRTLRKSPEQTINTNQYSNLKKAREALLHALAIEEKYEILLSNYEDFEKEILNQAVLVMVKRDHELSGFFRASLALNKTMINLLSAARMYLDQLNHDASKINKDIDIANMIERVKSEMYDNNFEYRFMEALRNHVQHKGLSVNWLQFQISKRSEDEEIRWLNTIEIASTKERLQKDNRFKKAILDEMPEKVDLKLAVRGYVGSLSSLHQFVRDELKDTLRQKRSLIEKSLNTFSSLINMDTYTLNAYKINNGAIIEHFPILLEWDDIRIKLVKRNRPLTQLKKCYVSGELRIKS